MDVTFTSSNVNKLKEIIKDLKTNIETTDSIVEALNVTVKRHRRLPVEVGCIHKYNANINAKYCDVCQLKINHKQSVRRLKICKHVFHTKCIDNWLIDNKQKCYLCHENTLIFF